MEPEPESAPVDEDSSGSAELPKEEIDVWKVPSILHVHPLMEAPLRNHLSFGKIEDPMIPVKDTAGIQKN